MIRRTVARHDLSTVEGQSAAVADSLHLIEGLTDPVRRSEYGHLLADLAGVSEGSVVIALERRVSGRPVEVRQAIKRASAQERVEREMLKLLARDAEIFDGVRARSSPRTTSARSPTGGCSSRSAMPAATCGVRWPAAPTTSAHARSSALARGAARRRAATSTTPRSVWARLQEFLLKSQSDALRMRLQKLNPTTEPGYDDLFMELVRRRR